MLDLPDFMPWETGRVFDRFLQARFEGGKWAEDWVSWDQLGMLQQLGVIPAPTAA